MIYGWPLARTRGQHNALRVTGPINSDMSNESSKEIQAFPSLILQTPTSRVSKLLATEFSNESTSESVASSTLGVSGRPLSQVQVSTYQY